jgi:membrane dipeptidase
MLLVALTAVPGLGADPHLETARRVLARTPLIDGHNDLPWAIRESSAAPGDVVAYDLRARTPGHTDVERLRKGMVGGQFWSVYVPCTAAGDGAARVQLEQIDIARQVIERYADVLGPALSASDVTRVFESGRIASILGMEGGHAIENSLGTLRAFYEMGARYLTLTHNCHTDWADAASAPPRHGGLTPFGREVVREMNRLGMLVDLSHTAPATMHAALDVSEAPVIWTHAGARALVDHTRNVPDDVLRRIRATGGILMVTFVPAFIGQAHFPWSLREAVERQKLEREHGVGHSRVAAGLRAFAAAHPPPPATLAEVADHVEHVRRVAGVDHVGVGADFDGITRVVDGLEDVSTYPALFAELARRGWTEDELAKLAGENILRVWRQAEEVARHLQRERGPSTATIEQLDRRR